jgi:hypothetical protein
LVRYPLQLTRHHTDVGRNYSDIVQNLERSYLCSDGSLMQEGLSKFDESGTEVPDFFADLAAEIDQRTLPCKLLTLAGEVGKEDVQNRGSFV